MGLSGRSNGAVRFGVFEIDLRNGELRKQGVRLRLQEQPFKVLAALLDQPGEVVSREQLVQRLWPDGTFVDFDRGLNAAVTRLRQVLADSAESPRYIETVARRGYRLLVPVQEVHEPGAPPPSDGRRYSVKGRWIATYAMLILIGAVVSLTLLRTPAEPKLEQITRDPGLATDPALSPDGKLLAYASDRGGQNLNLWVKQLNGEGHAVQLTHDASDAHEPSFSPDGSRIVYRSEQDGGGIYAIPAIGGEPALLIANGRNPRFAPDGKWIAYSRGRAFGEIFVMPASGGEPKRVGADLPPGGYPVWSPDSRQLLIYASPPSGMSLMDADWWTVTLEGGAARRTGSFAHLRSQGLPLQFATDVPQASVLDRRHGYIFGVEGRQPEHLAGPVQGQRLSRGQSGAAHTRHFARCDSIIHRPGFGSIRQSQAEHGYLEPADTTEHRESHR